MILLYDFIVKALWVHYRYKVSQLYTLENRIFYLLKNFSRVSAVIICSSNRGICGLPWWFSGKEPASQCKMWVQFLGQEDPLAKEMATHSSVLALEIPWTEELGGLSPWDHKRVWCDLMSKQQWRHLCNTYYMPRTWLYVLHAAQRG